MSYRFIHVPGIKGGIFRTRLADNAPLAPTSANYVARLVRQRNYTVDSTPVKGTTAADFNVSVQSLNAFSFPIYMMSEDHPTSRVNFRRTTGVLVTDNDPTETQALLSQAWAEVPVPVLSECRPGLGTSNNSSTAKTHQIESNGSDRSVCFVQKTADGWKMWEFWKFREDTGAESGWCAAYGGYVDNLLATQGMYRNGWGVTASGSVAACNRITWFDIERGVIDHALSLALPNTGLGTSTPRQVPPAIRGDSLALGLSPASGISTAVFNAARDADKIPHGTFFRLPANFDIDGWVSDSKTAEPRIIEPLMRAVMVALRDYGVIILDSTQGVLGWGFEDDRTIGTPYSPYATRPSGLGLPSGLGSTGDTKWAFRYLPYQYFQQVAVPDLLWNRRKIVKQQGGGTMAIRLR